MGIFKKRQNEKKSKENPSRADEKSVHHTVKEKSTFGQRSRISDEILRNGPDVGFAYYDEA